MIFKKDTHGLYLNGELKGENYTDAIKYLFRLDEIPKGFCVDEDYEADGYSVVDSNGVQHNYEFSQKEFYKALMEL